VSVWAKLRGAFKDLGDDGPIPNRPLSGELDPDDDPPSGALPSVARFSDPARPGEPVDVCARPMPASTGLDESLCGVCGHHGLVHPGWAGGTLQACVVCQLQDLLRQRS
jgi:hypothetical protein